MIQLVTWACSDTFCNSDLYIMTYILYNGIFSRRQIFAVLSKKHGDYFSRILIFAVGNVHEK